MKLPWMLVRRADWNELYDLGEAQRQLRMQADAEVERLGREYRRALDELTGEVRQHNEARRLLEVARFSEGQWRGRAQGARRAMQAIEKQIAIVTAEYFQLRREGFNPPSATPELSEAPHVVTPKVLKALRERMPPGTMAYGAMLRAAADRLLADEPEESVERWVLDGADPDDF